MYKKRVPLTYEQKDEIARLHVQEHLSLRQIAARFDKSPVAISDVLKVFGVDTSKAVACHVDTICDYCEKPIKKIRSRHNKNRYHFCGTECYTAYLRVTGDWRESPHGRKKSRATVALFYGLPFPEGAIVHHEDKDEYNSHPHNLILFECQKDHIRWHRGFKDLVTPLWVGKSVPLRQVLKKWDFDKRGCAKTNTT